MTPLDRKPTETALFRRAIQQHGLLRDDQLLAVLDRTDIRDRLRARRLTRVHRGVYAWGHDCLRDEGLWLAALWAGDRKRDALSHWSAGAFHRWKLPDRDDDRVHVSTLGEATSRRGLAVHRVGTLDDADVVTQGRLRVTTRPRTLVDLADVLTWTEFRALADDQRTLDLVALRRAQDRAPGRVGRGRVMRLIAADDAHTRSEFERRYLRFCTAHGIPKPDVLNERVAGHRADCLYRARRLVVELDGRAFHDRRAQMRADRERDSDYQLAGYRIMRLMWDDLHRDEAARTARKVLAMLAL